MKLVSNWKRVLRVSWSVRMAALAGVMGSVDAVLPLFQDAFPRGIFAGLTVLASIVAVLARVIEQKELRDGND